MLTKTLIIDERKELSTKYKKNIEDKHNEVTIIKELPLALKFIQKNEPDLILISDSIQEDLANFCSKIRVLTYNMRPVIVALSKSSEIQDKINILENGADDFISEPINSEEFKIRIKAHLRRESENNLDNKTKLPAKKYCMKALKRILASENDWVCLLTGVEHFFDYKNTYTELASDKLLQTFAAIISSSLDEHDFLGLYSENEFLIITTPLKAEKIASFITFAFDTVRLKFYSDDDLSRGYMLMRGADYSERRLQFIYAITAGITNKNKNYEIPEQILHGLKQIYSLAGKKKENKSNYLIQRPQITGKNSVVEKAYNNKILVIENDEALAFLLATTLNLKGYESKNIKNSDINNEFEAAVLIMDAGDNETMQGLKICKEIKSRNKDIKIIATSIYHDKETILNAGADIYLPKPYDVTTLVKWVDIALKEFNE